MGWRCIITRINTIAACDLTNEWLIAEVRELPRVVNELRDHPERLVLKDIPKKYTLSSGHVKFHRNKLLYLAKRHQSLLDECNVRGINIDPSIRVDLDSLPDHIKMFCCNDWTPTKSDHTILIDRLKERFALRSKAYHITQYGIKNKLDSDESFSVYYTQHLQKYLGE